ncbi:DUF6210 family protein [Sorangium sp. So ce315]|uniref:DUF6210 family protein n=1 Tax=Sorangium sp. So ce315 TaxID=3133299 RepID=UPI003F60748D
MGQARGAPTRTSKRDRTLREHRIVGIVTDRARLVDSHEAWVHVVIEGESEPSWHRAARRSIASMRRP